MNRSSAHTTLVNETLVALSQVGVMAWKNNTGVARSAAGGAFAFGLPGSADIVGCIPPCGRFLAVECKTGRGEPSEQQGKFGQAVEERGGLYVVARSVEDAVAAVEGRVTCRACGQARTAATVVDGECVDCRH